MRLSQKLTKRISFIFGAFLMSLMGFSSLETNAQYAFGFEVGAMTPLNQEGANTLMGFGAQFRVDITEKFRGGAMYSRYSRRDGSGTDFVRTSLVPVMGFFEYRFFDGSFSPFLFSDFGFYVRREIADNIVNEADLFFGGAPGLGFIYSLWDGMVISLSGRYHIIDIEGPTFNYIGFSVGLRSKF